MSDGIKQELPSDLAEVLSFPEPGSYEYNELRLRIYRNCQRPKWGESEMVVYDTVMDGFEQGLISVEWVGGEPYFSLTEAGMYVQNLGE